MPMADLITRSVMIGKRIIKQPRIKLNVNPNCPLGKAACDTCLWFGCTGKNECGWGKWPMYEKSNFLTDVERKVILIKIEEHLVTETDVLRYILTTLLNCCKLLKAAGVQLNTPELSSARIKIMNKKELERTIRELHPKIREVLEVVLDANSGR